MKQLCFFVFLKYSLLFKRNLLVHSGRNYRGRVCVQHQGGRDKHKYIKIDRFRFINFYGFILRILDVFFITSFLGLIVYLNGLISFIVLSEGVKKFSLVFSGNFFKPFLPIGSSQRLSSIKLFDYINSIELFPLSGAKIARAAGSFSKIIAKDHNFIFLKLNSGWQYKIFSSSLASLGISSILSFKFSSLRKAGLKRGWGVRPTVRGVIKNPCDHPHGGGEGKGSPPVAQVSPWGWLCKGTPTKQKKIDKLRRRLYKKIL